MSKTATAGVASEVRKLAKAHKISAEPDSMSCMAVTITRLAGDSVELDNIEQLLINLTRKGVLSSAQTLALQARYIQEKRKTHKKLSA